MGSRNLAHRIERLKIRRAQDVNLDVMMWMGRHKLACRVFDGSAGEKGGEPNFTGFLLVRRHCAP